MKTEQKTFKHFAGQGGSLPTSAKGTHRRDKARDKTSYPQRDKTNNNMNSNNSR